MHFHDFAQCRECKCVRDYTTPIANILILNDRCQYCGAWQMIGIIGHTWPNPLECPDCLNLV